MGTVEVMTVRTRDCGDPADVYRAACPCRDMLDLLANKWSALALGALEQGPQRFGALRARLQGVSPKVLTQTLRRLEDYGLVHREFRIKICRNPASMSVAGFLVLVRTLHHVR